MKQNLYEFMRDGRNSETVMWKDERTLDVVVRCEDCAVEVRYSKSELKYFEFQHAPGCPTQRRVHPKAVRSPTRAGEEGLDAIRKLPARGGPRRGDEMDIRDEQCYALAAAMGDVIEQFELNYHLDTEQILSTLALSTALVCTAGDMEESEAAQFARRSFRRHLQSVGASERALSDPQAQELAAPPNADRPEVAEGIQLAGEVLKTIAGATGPVALVALQSAMIDKILSMNVDHGAIAEGCAEGVRSEVLRRTPWNGPELKSKLVH